MQVRRKIDTLHLPLMPRGWMQEEYSKRWTIETCYRLVENARAKSFGSNRPARLFCFLYSLTLFNAWVLVNAQLGQLSEAAWRSPSGDAVVHENCHANSNLSEYCDSARATAGSRGSVSTSGITVLGRWETILDWNGVVPPASNSSLEPMRN